MFLRAARPAPPPGARPMMSRLEAIAVQECPCTRVVAADESSVRLDALMPPAPICLMTYGVRPTGYDQIPDAVTFDYASIPGKRHTVSRVPHQRVCLGTFDSKTA